MRKRIGFIVNPIAGMGGAVGLKGTDGAALDEARRRGARPTSSERAVQALSLLAPQMADLDLLTASGAMGALQCGEAGIAPLIVYDVPHEPSEARDTAAAAAAMCGRPVDLILFASGDGTARDIFAVAGADVPMLGIPAGVKMHSAVFATNPKNAARLALRFLDPNDVIRLEEAEIMDNGIGPGSPKLYGYARTPHFPLLRQSAKAASPSTDDADLDAACREIVASSSDDRYSFVGPGTATRRIKRLMGAEGTLLGVDVFRRGAPVGFDRPEAELLRIAKGAPARIIVGIVGGQGYLFGRGNQQISSAVIQAIGKEHIIAVASLGKLLSLAHPCLLVDSGDEAVDRMLSGYIAVRTGRGRSTMLKVAAP